jgi:uncharacterized DUF497 family protein
VKEQDTTVGDERGGGVWRGIDWLYNCTYTVGVSFEWDSAKALANRKKHGIDFADAVSALEDESALTMEDVGSYGERRWISVGMDGLGRLLVVVFTWRGDTVRLISARPATANERRAYEAEA